MIILCYNNVMATESLRFIAQGLPPDVEDTIQTILSRNPHHAPDDFFDHPEQRDFYVGFMLGQVLDTPEALEGPGPHPRERIARIFGAYGLNASDGEGVRPWANLYEHISGVTAAALTIGRRMQAAGVDIDLDVVRDAALLHDAPKPGEKARHGTLYNDISNIDHSLTAVLAAEGYLSGKLAAVVTAAENTSRAALLLPGTSPSEQRYVSTPAERHTNLQSKPLEAIIVGLADARSFGHHFATVDEARDSYLENPRKQDPASQAFFRDVWGPYYTAAEEYLEACAPGLNLGAIDDELIFRETIMPEARGTVSR